MPIRRIFLDWTRPALVAAAEHLIHEFAAPGAIDLENIVVAVPGGRAGRRLLEILVDRTDSQGLVLVPPRIVTVGKLPELLYRAKRPFADPFVQQLAWIEALRRSEPAQLERLSLLRPDDGDLAGQLGVGEMLARLHGELAADGLDCEQVAVLGAKIDGFREQTRWQALAHVERRYLAVLDGLGLWDRQTARLFAIRNRECRTEKAIVLVGTADLNLSQREMLNQVADRVTALVFAPERLADRFDEHGCLRSEAWQDVEIPLPDDAIEVVDKPTDQAGAVVRAIAAMDGEYSAAEITVGVPDERIIPYVQQRLEQCGASTRYGPGVPMAQSSPPRLLAAVADYLESRRFSAFAVLLRHPAIDRWLASQGIKGDWLSRSDDYHARHLPHVLDPRRLVGDERSGLLLKVYEAIQALLGGLTGAPRPLDQWARPIVELLVTVFGQSTLDPDVPAERLVLSACETIRGVLLAQSSAPGELMPTIDGADAVRLVLRQVAGESVAPPPNRGAVELLGWLELAMDDAPALVVTGLNEGIVPSSLNADLFLPNRLRRALKIEDNHRRYARDAYALSLLAASRKRLRLIAGRTAPEGEPLYPSRLLFACNPQTIVRRVAAFFHPDDQSAEPHERGRDEPIASPFPVPPPEPLEEPVTSMRVTEFRDYLACPYRYYLRHRLKLTALDDRAEELDALAFGSLLHDVLRDFGMGPAAASIDAEEIQAHLDGLLDRMVKRSYGKTALPAVRVQVEQLRARLAAFARWQVGWAAQGWRIESVERAPQEGAAKIVVDGQPMSLRGRIDRIDRHEPSGRRIIFDYKSSDTAASPDKAHRDKTGWVDLQLPLYRHLVAGMGIEGPIELGYILLPKDTSKVRESLAEWTEEDLQEADRTAEDVVREVRAEAFWPPVTPPPRIFQEFAAICQDEQFGSPGAVEAEGGAPA